MRGLDTAGRLGIALVVAAIAAVAGWTLFVELPTSGAELLGVVLVLAAVVGALRVGGSIGRSVFPTYNAAEVAVEGPITRDGGGSGPIPSPGSPGADDVVELIERADDDDAEALVLKLNTPGGAVVPSDDIRLAAKAFDGPTLAYATDVCASGGYWIASGCDELWAREGSVVGSIGVRGSRVTAADSLEKAGLEYEQLTAGEYKEAGVPFSDLEDHEREYLQGIVDDYYDQFETAAEMGLVDHLGTREDVEARLEELLDTEAELEELEPARGVADRLRGGAEGIAYAFGAGIAARFSDPGGEFRFRF